MSDRSRIIILALSLFAPASHAHAATYPIHGDLAGEIAHYTVQEGDTLYDIARKFDLGIVDMMTANPGVNTWVPEEGRELVIPALHILPDVPREGIVINLAELRLYYFPDTQAVMTYPLGIGQEGWQTPRGRTFVERKRKAPAWIQPLSIRRENPDLPAYFPPGPNNPLGAYALDLGWPAYRIHGTNHPYGIGWRSSHGCIRLYPEDIEDLFPKVDIGTPVTVIDKRYKLGRKNGRLWLEVTPTQQQVDFIVDHKEPEPEPIPGIYEAIGKAARNDASSVDEDTVRRALARPSAIPVIIAPSKKKPAPVEETTSSETAGTNDQRSD